MKKLPIALFILLAGVVAFSQAEPGAKLLLRNGEQVCFGFTHHPVIKTAHPIYLGGNFLILQKIYTFVP